MARLETLHVDSPTQLGAVVRARRRAQGLTQLELGELARVGARFVGELERGKPSIHVGKTLAVLATLGIAVALEYAEQAETRG